MVPREQAGSNETWHLYNNAQKRRGWWAEYKDTFAGATHGQQLVDLGSSGKLGGLSHPVVPFEPQTNFSCCIQKGFLRHNQVRQLYKTSLNYLRINSILALPTGPAKPLTATVTLYDPAGPGPTPTPTCSLGPFAPLTSGQVSCYLL